MVVKRCWNCRVPGVATSNSFQRSHNFNARIWAFSGFIPSAVSIGYDPNMLRATSAESSCGQVDKPPEAESADGIRMAMGARCGLDELGNVRQGELDPKIA